MPRSDNAGRLVRLEDQDRTRWGTAAIEEADQLIRSALTVGTAGRSVLQAAIAATRTRAKSCEQTDWSQIVFLYDRLLEVWPSPVVELNRIVAVAMVSGPQAALDQVDNDPERRCLTDQLPPDA